MSGRSLPTIRPRRQISGISAVLLPFTEAGEIDYLGFTRLLERTYAASLTPAVNMDTGYVNLLSRDERARVLALAGQVAAGRPFVAGAFIEGEPGDPVELYRRETGAIQTQAGTPILFQCLALKRLAPDTLVRLYRQVASHCDRLLAFELGEMFAPFGAIYSLETFQALMEIPQITGLKHSSLRRDLEWQRLELRDRLRPDFKVYTGNDLAIDMVMYGSDYLLGLSTFAPDIFARRDAYWAAGDPAFYTLNDRLQYLGNLAFRSPVPAYKHSAAQFLKLRGWIDCDEPHPLAPRRPHSDLEILGDILRQLESL